jgi:gamma-glutamyltranspeptidase
MGDTTNLESIFKDLQAKNQLAKNENIKAQTQLEESIKRLRSLLEGKDFIKIDYERLADKEYTLSVLEDIKRNKELLKNKFLESANKAREELAK